MKAKNNQPQEPQKFKANPSSSLGGIETGHLEHGTPYFRGPQYESTAATEIDLAFSEAGTEIEAISSSCGDRKGHVAETIRPLRLQCSDCEELLHMLSNVITAVLMNAQVLEWKLPPYSHLKRPIREIERNAQRGSELVKQLMRRLGNAEVEIAPCTPLEKAATAIAGSGSKDLIRDRGDASGSHLTTSCDPRTSGFFPKRDDGKERSNSQSGEGILSGQKGRPK